MMEGEGRREGGDGMEWKEKRYEIRGNGFFIS